MASHSVHAVAFGYDKAPRFVFEDLVEEFDVSLRQEGMNRREITFDNDDVAILRSSCAEIGLAWIEAKAPSTRCFLLILFGMKASLEDLPRNLNKRLYVKVLKRLSDQMPFNQVYRASFDDISVSTALLDEFASELQMMPFEEDEPADTAQPAMDLKPLHKAVDETMEKLATLYQAEERTVRDTFSGVPRQGQMRDYCKSAFKDMVTITDEWANLAEGMRRVMFEQNWPFEALNGSSAAQERAPQKSVLFGKTFVRKK